MRTCPTCGRRHTREHAYCLPCGNAYMRAWRKSHPPSPEEARRSAARAYANVYQRRGKLIPQPCEVCGSTVVEKHHDDYARPLVVRWFCRYHHRRLHRPTPAPPASGRGP